MLVVSLLLIWNVWDTYNIRTELTVVLFCDIAIATLQTADMFSDSYDEGEGVTRHIMSLRCAIFFVVSLLWPLHSAMFSNQAVGPVASEFVHPDSLDTLEGVLKNVETYDVFWSFMFAEEAQDLIAFFEQVALYSELEDDQERLDTAQRLFDTFLIAEASATPSSPSSHHHTPLLGSRNSINSTHSTPSRGVESERRGPASLVATVLSTDIITEIDMIIKSVKRPRSPINSPIQMDDDEPQGLYSSPSTLRFTEHKEASEADPVVPKTLFDQALGVVVAVMRRDYFPRFQTSTQYRELRAQAQRNQSIHKGLVRSNME
jgi:hypothetical protein